MVELGLPKYTNEYTVPFSEVEVRRRQALATASLALFCDVQLRRRRGGGSNSIAREARRPKPPAPGSRAASAADAPRNTRASARRRDCRERKRCRRAAWQTVPAVAAGHVYAPPDLPFNWGPRPPSVNRLPGLIWLAYAARRKPFDDEFRADVSRVFAAFYHVTPADAQLEQLIAVLGAARLRSDVVLAQEER